LVTHTEEEQQSKLHAYAVQLTKLSQQKKGWLQRESALKATVRDLSLQLESATKAVPRLGIAAARSTVARKLASIVEQQAVTPAARVALHQQLATSAAELQLQLDAFDAAEEGAASREEAKQIDALHDAALVSAFDASTKSARAATTAELARQLRAMQIKAQAEIGRASCRERVY
jgi:hypothetical protein